MTFDKYKFYGVVVSSALLYLYREVLVSQRTFIGLEDISSEYENVEIDV